MIGNKSLTIWGLFFLSGFPKKNCEEKHGKTIEKYENVLDYVQKQCIILFAT